MLKKNTLRFCFYRFSYDKCMKRKFCERLLYFSTDNNDAREILFRSIVKYHTDWGRVHYDAPLFVARTRNVSNNEECRKINSFITGIWDRLRGLDSPPPQTRFRLQRSLGNVRRRYFKDPTTRLSGWHFVLRFRRVTTVALDRSCRIDSARLGPLIGPRVGLLSQFR